ncbi:hypothetical protein M1N58_02095 [Dehalococcoidales bacterium]|nr:hypothetical protein [Dehalococcoidales bacterium]
MNLTPKLKIIKFGKAKEWFAEQKVEEQAPKLKVSGKLLNLHGQYAERIQKIPSVVYSRADIEETEKGEVPKIAKLLRTEPRTVHTFPKNGAGQKRVPGFWA